MTRQVRLSDHAYRLLKAKKQPNESFSDVIIRYFAPKGDPMDIFRIGRLDNADEYLETMRAADRRRFERLMRERR